MSARARLFIMAGLIVAALLLVVASAVTPSAQPVGAGQQMGDCLLTGITASASLGQVPGIWDTLPGEAINRPMYFVIPRPNSVITLSTRVSNPVSSCILETSPAFSALAQRNFTPTLLASVDITYPVDGEYVINGDFESGWYGWTYGQGPFLGHGRGLPQSIVLFEDSHRAVLGSPSLDHNDSNLPVGYAYMSQTVSVPSTVPTLTFQYRVHTFDTVYGLETRQYFDTFEFSVGKAPDQITEAERESKGCRGSALNPNNTTFIPSDNGLVFCGGGTPTYTSGIEWDSGWLTVSVNLSAFVGGEVTLYFADWNREYKAPYFDDQGYYNTYTYIDNVRFPIVTNVPPPTVAVVLTYSQYITGLVVPPQHVVTLTFLQDITPPTSVIVAPSQSLGRDPIKVGWSASDAGSGVALVSLFYRQVPTTTWTLVTSTQAAGAPTGAFTFVPPTVLVNAPVTCELTSQAVDHVGNMKVITGPDVSVMVWPSRVYLPLMRRDPPVVNGDFENGWYGWTHGQQPFLGHGSGLPSSIVLFDGSYRALLGSPALDDKNEALPVGYASMSQAVAVQAGATELTFIYRVHTFDTVYSPGTHEYFDTFEFSVGKAPVQITDADRESAGCRGSVLNPQDVTLTPSASGLVFCAGGRPTDSPGAPWDSGWRSAKVDLSAFANTGVTLYFANWNREYNAPYFNDKGYYNTYTYVDNVWFASWP